jgi:hypothetical protein
VTLRGIAAAVAAVVLLAAAPPGPYDPVPSGSQTALVRRYVDALAAQRYGAAFALLDAGARAYFRNAANFASAFTADGFAIVSYALAGTRGNGTFRVYFVRESIRLDDPARDVPASANVIVPYGVTGSGAGARIKDLGRPWRAIATATSATADGLRVTVKKVSFYEHEVALVVTFANVGNGFLTLLPYGRSVLRDADGALYRPVVNANWVRTDRRFFLGVRLAADEQITGVLSFATPRLDDRARRFTLTVGPNLRDGAGAPFALDVANLTVPA